MAGKAWAMNCLLLGAELNNLLRQGKDTEVVGKLRNLTSEFTDVDVAYMLHRLREICGLQHTPQP